jgi:hypothetical protein
MSGGFFVGDAEVAPSVGGPNFEARAVGVADEETLEGPLGIGVAEAEEAVGKRRVQPQQVELILIIVVKVKKINIFIPKMNQIIIFNIF